MVILTRAAPKSECDVCGPQPSCGPACKCVCHVPAEKLKSILIITEEVPGIDKEFQFYVATPGIVGFSFLVWHFPTVLTAAAFCKAMQKEYAVNWFRP